MESKYYIPPASSEASLPKKSTRMRNPGLVRIPPYQKGCSKQASSGDGGESRDGEADHGSANDETKLQHKDGHEDERNWSSGHGVVLGWPTGGAGAWRMRTLRDGNQPDLPKRYRRLKPYGYQPDHPRC